MRKYENELNKMFTEKVVEYLGKGYLFLNGDSSMGYFQRVDLYKNEIQLRLIIEKNSSGGIMNEYYGLIEKYEIRIIKMKLGQTFIRDEDDVIFERDLYVYKNKLISENVEELIKYCEIAYNRVELRSPKCFKKEFYPNKKINNIKGFKCFKKGEVRIRRYSNYYELENPKTGNTKQVFFKR